MGHDARVSIRHWPIQERPRERLLHQGPAALTTAELLAVILRSGRQGEDAVALARALLARSGGNLRRLAELAPGDLVGIPGIGPAKAAQIVAVLEIARRLGEEEFIVGTSFRSSYDVYAHFRERLAAARTERFYAVLLDNKNRKLKEVCISQGSLTASIVHPRDVFAPVIRESAAAVIFVHNHPSGDPTPSAEDIEITRRLRQVGDLVGVRVLDHIVIGKGRYLSLADSGYW